MKLFILTFFTASVLFGRVVCADFNTQQEAQNYFDSKQKGYKSLDGDKDGEACECLKGESSYDKPVCKRWRKKHGKD